ncbi:MAG: DUF935 family protein [Magnetococcales bacterium]|nr:DUF935 family protein [Magnetococcales bacterium]
MDMPVAGEIATIAHGRDITRGWVDGLGLLPPMDAIQRDFGRFLDIYEKVLEDSQVAATFQQRRLAVVCKPWEVIPGEPTDQGRLAADFIRKTLSRLDWDDLTERMLYARFYGFAVAECIWAREGDRIILQQLRVRDVRRFGFGPDFSLRLKVPGNLFGEVMPEKKFWVINSGASHHDEPYGLGLAYWLYWPVYFKRNGLRLWLKLLEKFGAPTAVGRFPNGCDEVSRNQLLSALAALQSDAGVILPEGMEIKLLEATRGGTPGYEKLYDNMNAAIAKVVLSQTMTTDSGASHSQAQVHMDVRRDVIEADADLIDNSFNRTVVAWLTAWNFPGVTPPIVRRIMIEPVDLLQRSERDRNLFTIGYRPTLEEIRSVYGNGMEAVPPAAA